MRVLSDMYRKATESEHIFLLWFHKGHLKELNKIRLGNFVCLWRYIHLLYSSATFNLECCGLCLATNF
jgi:hypothetical protein